MEGVDHYFRNFWNVYRLHKICNFRTSKCKVVIVTSPGRFRSINRNYVKTRIILFQLFRKTIFICQAFYHKPFLTYFDFCISLCLNVYLLLLPRSLHFMFVSMFICCYCHGRFISCLYQCWFVVIATVASFHVCINVYLLLLPRSLHFMFVS